MDQDVSVLFAPRSIDLRLIAEAARESFEKAHPENLHLHLVDERVGVVGLRRHVKQYTAVSLWSEDPGFAWDELGRVLSRSVPGRLLALQVAGNSGTGGFQLVEKGQLGDPCPSDDDDVALVRQGFEEAYVIALSEDEAQELVVTLATNATRGLCLYSASPDWKAGELLGPVEMERSRSELQCCLLDLPDDPVAARSEEA